MINLRELEAAVAALPDGCLHDDCVHCAWESVERALSSERMRLYGVRQSSLGMKDQWVATAEPWPRYGDPDPSIVNAYGPTPAAALNALRERLEERG